jgi:hypothetical protein
MAVLARLLAAVGKHITMLTVTGTVAVAVDWLDYS